jgi:Mn2+/Fe2+ NRAMP family transporter
VGTLRRLGPGLIIAGSIVGSGELIATTKTGAQAGFALLWLILIGCVIKVFVQIELGRYTISSGDTCLAGLNRVPGPRLRANWIVWFWVAMTLFGLAQLGGIVGGVGQALAISFPIHGDYLAAVSPPPEGIATGGPQRAATTTYTWDDKYWAIAVTAVTMVMLVRGRYGFVQAVSLALVVSFTVLTLGNVVSLQFTDEWRVSADEVLAGLSFQVPRDEQGRMGRGLLTALATFGIIGVGASELVAYPYWCLEKGYARFAGPRSNDPSWVERARGWMMVMHYDAWLSMVIYTVATLAFYVLGAAVLNRMGQDPDDKSMVPVLANAYVPVFGAYAKHLFLIGAFAVLYSTFFVATAGIARVAADALSVFGLVEKDDVQTHDRAVSAFCVLFPLTSVSAFLQDWNPVTLVLASGVMQSLMLPMLGVAALYFRYRRSDARLRPSTLWSLLLWISCAGLLVAGSVTAYNQFAKFFAGS